jgi:hypothetical protein
MFGAPSTRDAAGGARRQVLADLVVDLVFDPMVDELANQPARDRADANGREQRRRKHSNRKADARAPGRALATHLVARLPHSDRAVLRVRDQDHALDRNLLLLHERDKRLEVRRRRLYVLVPGDQDIRCFLRHRASFSGRRQRT